MLHSGRWHPQWSRWSILTEPTGSFVYRSNSGGQSDWIGQPLPQQPKWSNQPFKDLRQILAFDQDLWLGYLSYDLGRFIESLPNRAADDRQWPLIHFHRCTGWLVHDGRTGQWSAQGRWAERGAPDLSSCKPAMESFEADEPLAAVSQRDYEHAVDRAKQYIAAGDTFQVNLSQRYTAACRGNTRRLFERLMLRSPAWYGAYLELQRRSPNDRRRAIISSSPELFLQVEPDGSITTRPIKGTRPTEIDPAELKFSEKDQAELIMIVDLLRNDLGRVCSYRTIRVKEARHIESHPTVHHGVATITGQLHPQKDLTNLLQACLPGGSVTGAPKVRAMQIIDELEPVRRGPYCGSIGFVHDSQACFNIAIRTMLCEQDWNRQGRLDFSVGGGIVADSNPTSEYQETLDKATAMFEALGQRTYKVDKSY